MVESRDNSEEKKQAQDASAMEMAAVLHADSVEEDKLAEDTDSEQVRAVQNTEKVMQRNSRKIVVQYHVKLVVLVGIWHSSNCWLITLYKLQYSLMIQSLVRSLVRFSYSGIQNL